MLIMGGNKELICHSYFNGNSKEIQSTALGVMTGVLSHCPSKGERNETENSNSDHDIPIISSDSDWDKNWRQLGFSAMSNKGKMGLKVIPVTLKDQSGYTLSTVEGKRRAKRQLEEEIRQCIFTHPTNTELEDLDSSWQNLESAMGRMSSVQWGCALEMQKQTKKQGQEVVENQIDHRFDHSWVSNGLDPGSGWFWIPKGNITMEACYPAQQQEIRRFGYLAKKVRRLPPPAPLSHSFSRIVEVGMANQEQLRPPKRRQDDWRTEGWMEEDDLLQEDFKQEQDLRRQLQKDPRYPDGGAKGTKQEGNYSQALVPSGPDHERVFRGKGFVGGRGEGHQGGRVQTRNPGQQRGWSQGPNLHGNRNLDSGGRFTGSSGERQLDPNLGQGMSKEGDLGHINNKGNRVPNQDVKCFRCLGTGHF